MCQGTGTMSWQQPSPDGSVLRTIEMDCPNGCGASWKHPHAERHRVVDQPDDRPARVRGRVDESQEIGADFIRQALANWGFSNPR
ncbi:hypothetical protein BJF85_16795 [Saccharomonospora sp. CUA-673]|nr:hypothetical protein BJF85_16795 [Saccharomonospora sp. CUA-673]